MKPKPFFEKVEKGLGNRMRKNNKKNRKTL